MSLHLLEAKRKIDKIIQRRIQIPDGESFHYTKLETFKKIINSKIIYLPSIFEQNGDPNELYSGIKVLFYVFEENISQIKNDEMVHYYTMVFEMVRRQYKEIANIYVLCTSYSHTHSFLWEIYGDKHKGICIGLSNDFKLNFLETSKGPKKDNDCSAAVHTVHYKERNLVNLFRKIIDIYIRSMIKDMKRIPDHRWDAKENLFKLYVVELLSTTISYCIDYKPKKFKSECEKRFIRMFRHDKHSIFNKSIPNYEKEVLCLPIENNEIKRIIIGEKAGISEDDVNSLLMNNGFKNYTIELAGKH
jgi:hypothetical protein